MYVVVSAIGSREVNDSDITDISTTADSTDISASRNRSSSSRGSGATVTLYKVNVAEPPYRSPIPLFIIFPDCLVLKSYFHFGSSSAKPCSALGVSPRDRSEYVSLILHVDQSHIQRTLAQQHQNPPLRPARGPSTQPTMAGTQGNKDADIKNKYESVFGPNIGSVNDGPAWTQIKEKKVLVDELTADVVQGWIEKTPSNEATDDSGDISHHHHHHGLEFEFDCDAPKCGIYVHVHLLPEHPEATGPSSTPTKILVYEKLGRYDVEQVQAESKLAEQSDSDAADNTTPVAGAAAATSESNANSRHARRRFTNFHFRRRTHVQNRSVAGPALAVLDAEPAGSPGSNIVGEDGEKDKKDKEQDKQGARVAIRLAALDEQGAELSSPNEQVTYLHILRFGVNPALADGGDAVEDTRPWVVKVVKREATIGPHTFQLHEIFGLSSSSKASHTPAPTAPLPTTSPVSHTYPPTTTPSATTPPDDGHDEEDPSSECLVCLSSPREVVLLPCRHLVACKDCAVNMVEFGAGGNITQTEEPAAGTNGAEANEDGDNQTGETAEAAGAHVLLHL
ncbi:hydroxyproline-rich glycoprotein [Salix suchowensis]|nr:hydroxyproline-rich glycoprotein [Salix suchowensis]